MSTKSNWTKYCDMSKPLATGVYFRIVNGQRIASKRGFTCTIFGEAKNGYKIAYDYYGETRYTIASKNNVIIMEQAA
jgi:hypothetical protein